MVRPLSHALLLMPTAAYALRSIQLRRRSKRISKNMVTANATPAKSIDANLLHSLCKSNRLTMTPQV